MGSKGEDPRSKTGTIDWTRTKAPVGGEVSSDWRTEADFSRKEPSFLSNHTSDSRPARLDASDLTPATSWGDTAENGPCYALRISVLFRNERIPRRTSRIWACVRAAVTVLEHHRLRQFLHHRLFEPRGSASAAARVFAGEAQWLG